MKRAMSSVLAIGLSIMGFSPAATAINLEEPMLVADLITDPHDQYSDSAGIQGDFVLGTTSSTYRPVVEVGTNTYFIARASDAFTTLYSMDQNRELTRVMRGSEPVNNIYALEYVAGNNLVFAERTGAYLNYASFNLSTLSYQSYPELKIDPNYRFLNHVFGSRDGYVAFFATTEGTDYELYLHELADNSDPVPTGYITENPGDVIVTSQGLVFHGQDGTAIKLMDIFDLDEDQQRFEITTSITGFTGDLYHMPDRDLVLATQISPNRISVVELDPSGISSLSPFLGEAEILQDEKIDSRAAISGTRFVTLDSLDRLLSVYQVGADLSLQVVETLYGSNYYDDPVLYDAGQQLYVMFADSGSIAANMVGRLLVDLGEFDSIPHAFSQDPELLVPNSGELGVLVPENGDLLFSHLETYPEPGGTILSLGDALSLKSRVTESDYYRLFLAATADSAVAMVHHNEGDYQAIFELGSDGERLVRQGAWTFEVPVVIGDTAYFVNYETSIIYRFANGNLEQVADITEALGGRTVVEVFNAGETLIVLGIDEYDELRPSFVTFNTNTDVIIEFDDFYFPDIALDENFNVGDLNDETRRDFGVSKSENFALFASPDISGDASILFNSGGWPQVIEPGYYVDGGLAADHIFEFDGKLYLTVERATSSPDDPVSDVIVELDQSLEATQKFPVQLFENSFYPLGSTDQGVILATLLLHDQHPLDQGDLRYDSVYSILPGMYFFHPDTGIQPIPGTQDLVIDSAAKQIANLGDQLLLAAREEVDLLRNTQFVQVADLWSVTTTGATKVKQAPKDSAGFAGHVAKLGEQLIASVIDPQYGAELFSFNIQAQEEQSENQDNTQETPTSQTPASSNTTNPLLQAELVSTSLSPGANLQLKTQANITSVQLAGVQLYFRKSASGYEVVLPTTLSEGELAITINSGSFSRVFKIEQASALRSLDQRVDSVIKRSGNTARVVLYDLVDSGKVQVFVNGKEIAWINAASEADLKLRAAPQGKYLVRSFELKPGKNVIEIFQEGERLRRVAYSR